MEVGLSWGRCGDRRGICAAVVTFMGRRAGQSGWAVRLEETTSLSSPKRPCKEAGMQRRPREARMARGHRWESGQGQRPPEMGALRGGAGLGRTG